MTESKRSGEKREQGTWEQGNDDKAEGKYTTRHGSHLTKTSEGVEEENK